MNFINYIDPGTGSMLLTVILGLATTLVFVFRGFFIKLKYRILGGKGASAGGDKKDVVIFSDHKRYWNVFQPVLEEMNRRGITGEYWAMSADDPALEQSYEHIKCEFIGEGSKGFARLNTMRAYVCLSTTPGLDVLQWKRSKDTDWYVHIYHSAGDNLGYRMFGLDYYDAVLETGDVQTRGIRTLEQLRGLPAKELVITGATYLDTMKARADFLADQYSAEHPNVLTENHAPAKKQITYVYSQQDMEVKNQTVDASAPRQILLAPSWGESSILQKYGAAILQSLKDTGYRIVVRPHPQSLTAEKDLLDALMAQFPESEAFSWNFDNDNFSVLSQSDLMISDYSGVVFDYVFIFDRPIIYADVNMNRAPYDSAWVDYVPWTLDVLSSLGKKLDSEDFPRMKEVIDSVLFSDVYKEGRSAARKEAWSHIGEGAVRSVDYIESKLRLLKTTNRSLDEIDAPISFESSSSARKESSHAQTDTASDQTCNLVSWNLDRKSAILQEDTI